MSGICSDKSRGEQISKFEGTLLLIVVNLRRTRLTHKVFHHLETNLGLLPRLPVCGTSLPFYPPLAPLRKAFEGKVLGTC